MVGDLSSIVGCHAGYSGCDHPSTVLWNGTRGVVERILREFRLPEGKTWQVIPAQGNELQLSFITRDQRWTVTEVIRN